MDGERVNSPPPSYNEAIGEPPPAYTETEDRDLQTQRSNETSNNNRIVPTAWTGQAQAVVTQPRSISTQGLVIADPETSSSQKRGCSCNAYCFACKNKPCTFNGECFCYNCLAFVLYAPTCGLGTLICVCCKRICPETYGDCPASNSSLRESYLYRHDNVLPSLCWFVCGPLCCLYCDETSEVCPLATPCNTRFGLPCIRKMTCYCGGNSRSDCRCNPMDENACGFIWDCKEIDCKLYN